MRGIADLSPRERWLLLLVLPVAVVLGGYLWGWLPLQELRAAREAEIAGYRLVALSAAGAGTLPPQAEAADPVPFAARVTRSAEAAGLSLRRLEPEGDRLRVTVEDTAFAQVVLWIADLEAERDVTLAAIEVDRRPTPGSVSARLLLEDAP